MNFPSESTIAPSLPTGSEFVVVGAGLAGLAAALTLHRAGREVVVLERAGAVGGRVRTDIENGFVLDRGFQVLLTAYPEIDRYLDLSALDLRPFVRGVSVWDTGSFSELIDPRTSLSGLMGGLRTRVLTPTDRVRLLRFTIRLLRSPNGLLDRVDDCPMGDFLKMSGFSDKSVQRLWEPLLSGIQLTPSLEGSARLACLIIRCLATGPAAVPAGGMQAIPDQMASRLPDGSIRLRTEVDEINESEVVLSTGDKIAARRVVVATEQRSAARLLNEEQRLGRAQWYAYFSATEPPNESKTVHLLPSAQGPCRNVAVMSNVAPEYAPDDAALIVAAGPTSEREPPLAQARRQLARTFGAEADSWELIKQGVIAHAQPLFVPGAPFTRQPYRNRKIVVAGDHRTTPSIQGALVSGRVAAEAAMARA
ncbi:MAG: NAD(P)/FAD-dependent oxidoreductase [Acidimicrobiales bacterium]|nr:NAD(P)/FAD-dependent oxidoreductase [Acidimicrobiales bacterium]